VRVTIHQPDLLPYSGFWFKMATTDRFVIAVHDQFQKHGYQRRVTMRDAWCSHQLVGKPSLIPINEVRVAPGWQDRLADVIRGRYTGSRHFASRGRELLEGIAAIEVDERGDGARLDEVNVALIHVVRRMLGLETELVFTDPPAGRGIDRLIEQVTLVGGTSYLSGQGGAAYLGEHAEEHFAEHGIRLEWSDHLASTGDSIVSVLMDDDDPMASVMRRQPPPTG